MSNDNLMLTAINNIMALFPDIDRHELAFMLYEFSEIHGEQAIAGIVGFIGWSRDNNLPERTVKATIAHDLNGRKDRLFSPRSYSYA